VTEETKETKMEEVSCPIPAHCKLTVVMRWKKIWHHGYIVATRDAVQLHIFPSAWPSA
jgi:C4-type Zn-finger protein